MSEHDPQPATPNESPRDRGSHLARRALRAALALMLGLGALPPMLLDSAQSGGPVVRNSEQQMGQQMGQPMGRQGLAGDVQYGQADSPEQERRLRALNAERQKSLVSDTNKLLKLAHELDAEVSSTDSNTLNPDQLRKLAEIEKLAHSVKEKMSTSVRGVSVFQQEPSERYP